MGQLPQTSYQALLTPYSFIGLGRTNNYIENLFVGSTKQSEQHFISMEGVIPNSKVVIYPPSGDGSWRRELYLRPGSWIPWVTVTVVAAALLLAVIVFVLRLNEKVSDLLYTNIVSRCLMSPAEGGWERKAEGFASYQLWRFMICTLGNLIVFYITLYWSIGTLMHARCWLQPLHGWLRSRCGAKSAEFKKWRMTPQKLTTLESYRTLPSSLLVHFLLNFPTCYIF